MSNVFSFTGVLGRDCEVRQVGGSSVLNFTVANSIGFGDKKQTNWVRVAVWGKRAEGQLQDFLKKGQQVFVSGELSQREYQSEGVTKTSLELNAVIVDLVGGAKTNDVQRTPAPQQQQQKSNNNDFGDEDIPF
jgi:single-strand DNA-binding protein